MRSPAAGTDRALRHRRRECRGGRGGRRQPRGRCRAMTRAWPLACRPSMNPRTSSRTLTRLLRPCPCTCAGFDAVLGQAGAGPSARATARRPAVPHWGRPQRPPRKAGGTEEARLAAQPRPGAGCRAVSGGATIAASALAGTWRRLRRGRGRLGKRGQPPPPARRRSGQPGADARRPGSPTARRRPGRGPRRQPCPLRRLRTGLVPFHLVTDRLHPPGDVLLARSRAAAWSRQPTWSPLPVRPARSRRVTGVAG